MEIYKFSNTIDNAIKFLNEIAFVEAHPVMPSVKDIQNEISTILHLSCRELKQHGNYTSKEFLSIYKDTELERLVNRNWGEDVILFQPNFIEDRLRSEGCNDCRKIDFYLSQCYQLNAYIIDKLNQMKEFVKVLRHEKQPPTDEQATAPQLPSELDTKQARKYFARAVEAGLMSKQYEWQKSQLLLSFFAQEMSIKLGLNKAQNKDGSSRISWKPFEILFGIEKGHLRQSMNDFKKDLQEPMELDIVTTIFQD